MRFTPTLGGMSLGSGFSNTPHSSSHFSVGLNPPNDDLQKIAKALQIGETGISHDIINPLFALVLPLQITGIPEHCVKDMVRSALKDLPINYEDHLRERLIKLQLPVDEESIATIVKAGVEAVRALDSYLHQIRFVLSNSYSATFCERMNEVLRLVDSCGEVIFGQNLWQQRSYHFKSYRRAS